MNFLGRLGSSKVQCQIQITIDSVTATVPRGMIFILQVIRGP